MSVPIPPAKQESSIPIARLAGWWPSWTSADPSGARAAVAIAATLLVLVASAAGSLWFDDTQQDLKAALLVVVLALAVAALRSLWLLTRHAHDATGSLLRFAQRVGRDDLVASVLDSRRSESVLGGATVLDEVASDLERSLTDRERRWRSRARLSSDWYWETDDQLRFTYVSDDLKSHLKLGLRPEDLIGRRHDEVRHYMPPVGGWDAFTARMKEHKSFREVQIEVRRPGRSAPVWMALSAKPRRDVEGRFIGYKGVGRDITEQHLAFKRLHDSERRYAVIADLSADWYWETDAEHRLSFLGPLVHDLMGEAATQAIGRRRWELNVEGASEDMWARHRADLDARRPFRNLEFVVQRPRRGVLWVSVSGLPRIDEKGQFIGYHGVGRDITLQKRAEKVLLTRNAQLERLVAERTAELEQSNRDLEAFSRQLAHELRTPIGHVVGFADLLRLRAWDRLRDDEREWLTLQARSAHSMSATVTALLELARSGSMALERQMLDLSALANALIAELPPLDRRAPVRWSVEPGLVAHCSAPLVRMVLMNLLGNAAKFTRDVEAPRVWFGRLPDDGSAAVYAVEDNGAGFDAERAAKLFQPFVRLHSSEQFQGTGVGLSIVRRIVERHGGWIRASARPGAGARFEFTLAAPSRVATPQDGETTDDVPAAGA